jgi:hypothetical protein
MKATVRIGYKDYVMDADKALTLLGMLEDAEVYESKWDSKSNTTSHYIFPQDEIHDSVRELRIIPTAMYKLAKLAGKPEKGV